MSTTAVSGIATAQYIHRYFDAVSALIDSAVQSNMFMLKNVYLCQRKGPISSWKTYSNERGRKEDSGQNSQCLHCGTVFLASGGDHLALLCDGATKSVLVLCYEAEYLYMVSYLRDTSHA